MAQRRMFSKVITNSSRFLMMPQSAQNLYFHLGMNADDDGFCEHFTIMRMTESKPDDLRILQSKEFVKIFDDKVLIVLDWKENNYVRSDRYTPSRYLKIYKEELELLSGIPIGIPNDNQRLTQDRIGKDRIGKDNTDKREEKTEKNNADSLLEEKLEEKNDEIQDIQGILAEDKDLVDDIKDIKKLLSKKWFIWGGALILVFFAFFIYPYLLSLGYKELIPIFRSFFG